MSRRSKGSSGGSSLWSKKSSAPSAGSKPASLASAPPKAAPAPAPYQQGAAPAGQHSMPPAAYGQPSGGGGMMSGIGGAIVQGMAMGTGSAIAHRAVDAIAGPRTMVVEHKGNEAGAAGAGAGAAAGMAVAGAGAFCQSEQNSFQKCLDDNKGNYTACKFYFDVLSHCQANSQQS